MPTEQVFDYARPVHQLRKDDELAEHRLKLAAITCRAQFEKMFFVMVVDIDQDSDKLLAAFKPWMQRVHGERWDMFEVHYTYGGYVGMGMLYPGEREDDRAKER